MNNLPINKLKIRINRSIFATYGIREEPTDNKV